MSFFEIEKKTISQFLKTVTPLYSFCILIYPKINIDSGLLIEFNFHIYEN